MSSGDLGLVDTVGAMQLAIQAAISEVLSSKLNPSYLSSLTFKAFQTPEILRLFALAQPDHLRNKLQQIERYLKNVVLLLCRVFKSRDFIVGKMEKVVFTQQKLEILTALTKLDTTLTEEEQTFYDQNNQSSMKQFTKVQETIVIKDGFVTKK